MKNFAMPSDDQVVLASDGFRLLADPTRIKILWALLQGESSVSCLAELVGTSPTAVSQHLSKLRLSKLVKVRREGTFAYYSAADDHVARLLAEALFHADHQVQDLPDHPSRKKVLSQREPRAAAKPGKRT
ncbi:MAG: ArsR/SmtB family transcription factor [Acidimicrobiales bacterium]